MQHCQVCSKDSNMTYSNSTSIKFPFGSHMSLKIVINVFRVTARDKDASRKYNTVSYRLGDSYNKTFRIHSHTGDIYLEKLIDYDPPNNQINFNLLVNIFYI